MWYADGLPAGKSFLASLFALQRETTLDSMVPLSRRALRDLNWWRSIIAATCICPHILGARIDAVRRCPTVSIYMRTDASSLIGAGGVVSMTQGGDSLDWPDSAIRWTKRELEMFLEGEIYINTLEYFAAVYCIMLWGDRLRGHVISLECDNTAAVAWLSKGRATAGG
jgi:hypothetical protein